MGFFSKMKGLKQDYRNKLQTFSQDIHSLTCIGEKEKKKKWFVTKDWDNVTTGKKKSTIEALRS